MGEKAEGVKRITVNTNQLSPRKLTEQEEFWLNEFGEEYTERNENEDRNNMAFWKQIMPYKVGSILELGANRGSNLKALRKLNPQADITAVEINPLACDKLRGLGAITVHQESIFDFKVKRTYELVFTKGVLIHINPGMLKSVYSKMHYAAEKYIVIAEYYNPTPATVEYRGHHNKLFKRDFAGEMLDMFPDLSMVGYGFWYHRDAYPQDDINYFILRKS